MPEYLAPGVFVEEVSFRAKSVEGVPTSTTGFAGIASFGPVHYPGGPLSNEPRLVTSFPEFERAYGKLDPLNVGGGQRLPYLAHAARAFFLNGGHRLYISRVFKPNSATDTGVAGVSVPVPTPTPTTAAWRARWPGSMGNVAVRTTVTRSRDVARHSGTAPFANLAQDGTIVEVVSGSTLPDPKTLLNADSLRIVRVASDGTQSFQKLDGSLVAPAVSDLLSMIELNVLVVVDPDRTDASSRMGVDPNHSRFVGRILDKEHPHDEDSVVWLDFDFSSVPAGGAISVLLALVGTASPPGTTVRLTGGNEGALPLADDFLGLPADPDDITKKATGLEALGEVDDIAIEAVPDAGALPDDEQRHVTVENLIRHCELARYRIAVVDGPPGASINEIRQFRAKFDSSYAALYHPWVEILDPNQPAVAGVPPQRILIPPSGFVAGIYGRSDVARGVFKAPANEVVYGLTKFEVNINQGRNEVLNPEGINALRFFPGRSYRVWGARTMSSDPEWIYVNVRRLFIFLEHSIDKATQWAVFEPNNEALWRNVVQEVSDFLEVQWRAGALLGSTTAQAYFVRCDRTTMTQNDIDNGRMICLVGVAPTRPAEFVIFRIGQWTSDAVVQ